MLTDRFFDLDGHATLSEASCSSFVTSSHTELIQFPILQSSDSVFGSGEVFAFVGGLPFEASFAAILDDIGCDR